VRQERALPVSHALMPQWLARLSGFTAIAIVGALEWKRLVGDLSAGSVLLWVLAAFGAAVLVLLAERAPQGRPRAVALLATVLIALFAGYSASRTPLYFLKPHHWDDLASGLGNGFEALATVKLPYVSADPWPAVTLQVLGAELLVLAALLAFWPRRPIERRDPLAPPERGYPFLALSLLMVVVASPVISLGGTRGVALGLILAALTFCFLWLERLPLRPGLGVAALAGVALAGALPLAAVADRGRPWFDYRSFTESLAPGDPIHFNWSQTYGTLHWPRDGDEVMAVKSSRPLYWKTRDLASFDGTAWTQSTQPTPAYRNSEQPWEADLPESFVRRVNWITDIDVSIKRMSSVPVPAAGTTIGIKDASRNVQRGSSAGTFDSAGGPLRRGDSYTASVYAPEPDQAALADATTAHPREPGDLDVTIPLAPGESLPGDVVDPRIRSGSARFPAFGQPDEPQVSFPGTYQPVRFDGDQILERSQYARTWALVKRLKRGTKTPFDYIENVDVYLHSSRFFYTEKPPTTPLGQAPLDFFINQSHAGYCQHFAGAMALMLRMGGVPARVATGFSPGGFSAKQNAWIVRDTDAHAWVEVWFDRYGWVPVDPTPPATPARSLIAALTPEGNASIPSADRGSAQKNPEGGSGATSPARVRPDLLPGTSDPQSGGGLTEDGLPIWAWGLIAVLVIALLTLTIAIARRPRGAVAELEDALRRVGRPVTAGTTLHQLERRLGSHSPEAAGYLRALTAGRYAPASPRPTRAGRRAVRRALASGLGPTGRLRALWALPPRPRVSGGPDRARRS
jgi:transglutaminase-like putative cysteine protease